MFKRILVPLDGSGRAEQAIPLATRIARATGGSVVLLQVANPAIEYGPYLAQAPSLAEAVLEEELEKAKNYLHNLMHAADVTGIEIEAESMPGVVAQTILSYAESCKADLIIICSHGYTGFKRWALGSVAQKVARHSPVPVLVLREEDAGSILLHADATHPLRALVALDGSRLAEASLEPAASLVIALTPPSTQATLHLTQVVQIPTALDRRKGALSVAEMREQALSQAWAYLESAADVLHKGLAAAPGLNVTWSATTSEDVADALIRMAELGEDTGTPDVRSFDLIAMATHGRSGLQRWTIGSITERVLNTTRLPLLITRVHEQSTTARSTSTEEG